MQVNDPVSSAGGLLPGAVGVSLGALFTDAPSHQAGRAAPPVLHGCIDVVTPTLIEGWVWDPLTPRARIALHLVEDGCHLATARADLDRPGLAASGVGDGRHAFRFDLAPGLLSGEAHTLHLHCATTGAVVPGSPIALEAFGQPARVLRWHVDEITDVGAVGWIFAPDDIARRCIVVLKEAGQVHSRAAASRFRPGLAEAGLGDGRCAFLLPLSQGLLDGEEHLLDIIEESTGIPLTAAPLRWRSAAGSAGRALTGRSPWGEDPPDPSTAEQQAPTGPPDLATIECHAPGDTIKTRLLFDISDFVYHISGEANLSGIQRVQASIMLALLAGAVPAGSGAIFLSFNGATGQWEAVPTQFLSAVLHDLFRPALHRTVRFPSAAARLGHLPGAQPFDAEALLAAGPPSVLCLLGAGWNRPDHCHQVLWFKRRFATRFVMLVHDLMPIVAPETCNPETAADFIAFLRRAAPHTDRFLAVSQNTASDLRRYVSELGLAEPDVTVTRNGSSFAEFLPLLSDADPSPPQGLPQGLPEGLPERFVLYVSTLEGRKNHAFLLDLWRRMRAVGQPPALVCVGRVGWKCEALIAELAASNNLDGCVIVYQDVSDTQLRRLYAACLFTVYPSLYEGWGLPVGESLAAGKICVCSTRASLPEVAGDLTPCLDLEDVEAWHATLHRLIQDETARLAAEATIRSRYRPISWASVATTVALSCAAAVSALRRPLDAYPVCAYATEISFAAASADRLGCFLPDALTETNFIAGEQARGEGRWAAPEPWGTWLCEASGDLVLVLPRSDSRVFYLFLRLRASAPVASAPASITASITADAAALWQGRLVEKPQTLVLRLRRPPPTDGTWRLTLRFAVELSNDQQQAIDVLDRRQPHIGFESLVVVPEDDLKTRLDILTGLQMAAMSA